MTFKLNRAAFRELRNSPEVLADLEARAERVHDAAEEMHRRDAGENDPFRYNAQEGRNRARAGVVTSSAHAMNADAKYNILLRALEAGRD